MSIHQGIKPQTKEEEKLFSKITLLAILVMFLIGLDSIVNTSFDAWNKHQFNKWTEVDDSKISESKVINRPNSNRFRVTISFLYQHSEKEFIHTTTFDCLAWKRNSFNVNQPVEGLRINPKQPNEFLIESSLNPQLAFSFLLGLFWIAGGLLFYFAPKFHDYVQDKPALKKYFKTK